MPRDNTCNVFNGATLACRQDRRKKALPLALLFQDLPVALLWGQTEEKADRTGEKGQKLP